MARARNRVCSQPGCPHIQPDSMCPEHRQEVDRRQQRTTPTKVTRDHAERMRRSKTVKEWRDRNGNVCPGHGRPAHQSSDLTADHITPIGIGGAPDGPLRVLCRSCNSRKADRTTS